MSTLKLPAASGGGSISIKGPASAGSDTDLLDTSGNLAISGTSTLTGNVTTAGTLYVGTSSYGGGGAAPGLYVSNSSGRQVKIHNTSDSTSSLQLTNSGSGEGDDAGLQVAVLSNDHAWINNAEDAPTRFATNGTERMRINAAGDIWIGQLTNGGWGSTAAGVVHIRGNDMTNGLLRINDTGGASDQVYIRFQYNDHGSNCGGIRRDGTSQDPEFFSGSDKRIKTKIADMPNVLDKINQVKIKTWELKSDADTKGTSPIAQDLATIFPDKVTKTDDGTGDTVPDGVEPWTIGNNFTWELIKAIQELTDRVAALESS